MDRPTPFDLVFSGLAPEWFPQIRDALTKADARPQDRDAFLLTLPAMQLLRQLRPDDSDAGAGVDELTALVHHAYLAWVDGARTWTITEPAVRARLASAAPSARGPAGAGYLQLPARLVWASLVPAGPWEPLDGCFVHGEPGGTLRVLGVFGLHPSRNGFTVAEAAGTPGSVTARRDGTPLFAPALDGGGAAGLHAVVEPGELVELAARALTDVEGG